MRICFKLSVSFCQVLIEAHNGLLGSRVRLGLQRQGTYLVVELERRPSTPAGALTAFMGAMGNGEP